MSHISTHVLDTARGQAAAGIPVSLEAHSAGDWILLGSGVTDADGRVAALLPSGHVLTGGTYRLRFATDGYFRGLGLAAFYPEVIVQAVLQAASRYHLPLLLSQFGYSTYRGS